MRKEQVLSRMREECLIAVIRAKNPEQGEKIVEAVIAGGIHFIEITMTMDEGNRWSLSLPWRQNTGKMTALSLAREPCWIRNRKSGDSGGRELCGESGTESGHH